MKHKKEKMENVNTKVSIFLNELTQCHKLMFSDKIEPQIRTTIIASVWYFWVLKDKDS